MFRSMHHVGLTVADLDRSVSFYTGVLGCRLLATKDARGAYIDTITGMPDADLRIALLELPGTTVRLELLEYVSPTGRTTPPATCDVGAGHVCLEVEDIDAAIAFLRERGVHVRSQPVTSPDGPNRGSRAVYLDDPDGSTVELLQPPGRTGPT